MPSWVLNSSKDGNSTVCHGDAVLGLTPFTVKRVFHIFLMEFPVFQFVPVASLISTEKHLVPSSLFYKIPLSLFFSRLCNHSSFTLSSCQLPQSLNHLHGLSLDCSTMPMSLLSWGAQDSTALQECLSCAEKRGSITSLAQLCLMQPRMLLAFFATSMHCRLLFNLSPIRTWVLSMFGNSFQGYLVYLQNEGKGLK